MDKKQAEAIAAMLGGTAWQSGGNIWLVLFTRSDGKMVVLSDDVVSEYADDERFENRQCESQILLH